MRNINILRTYDTTEAKMKLYLTRDKAGQLFLSNKKMYKQTSTWELKSSQETHNPFQWIRLPKTWHPEIKWEDKEPQDCELLF